MGIKHMKKNSNNMPAFFKWEKTSVNSVEKYVIINHKDTKECTNTTVPHFRKAYIFSICMILRLGRANAT